MAEANTGRSGRVERPLSPHLQIYRMPISMLMSIIHRITGGGLYVGTVLFVWWLAAVASGPDYFAYVSGLFGSWPGLIVMFGYTWALLHHMLGGIRHFIWDTGHGYDLETVDLMSWGTLAGSAVLTLLVWAAVLFL